MYPYIRVQCAREGPGNNVKKIIGAITMLSRGDADHSLYTLEFTVYSLNANQYSFVLDRVSGS